MMDAKTINVLLEGYFKLSRHKNRRLKMRSSHVKGVICISCEQFNVCYSLYEVRNYSSSGSCQQIHEQSEARAVESN